MVPIDETGQLQAIRRVCGSVYSIPSIASVTFTPLLDIPTLTPAPGGGGGGGVTLPAPAAMEAGAEAGVGVGDGNGEGMALESARARELVKLPPVLWAPIKSRHKQFPKEFRLAVDVITLTCRFSNQQTCPASRLPQHIWEVVLSYATRDWFVPIKSHVEVLCEI